MKFNPIIAILLVSLQLGTTTAQSIPDSISDSNKAPYFYNLMKGAAYSDPNQAKLYGRLTIEHSATSDRPDYYLAKANNGLGIIHKNQGNYDSALLFLTRAKEIYTTSGDIKGEALAINNIGILYNDMGDYVHAVEEILKAVRLGDSLGIAGIQSVSTNNLGIVQYEQKLYEKALVNFRKSKEYYELDENLRGAAGAQINIATTLAIQLGQLELGKKAFLEASKIKDALNDQRGVSFCQSELANIYLKQQQYDSAIFYLDKAIAIKLNLDDKKGLVTCYTSMAETYLMNNKTQESVHYAQKSYNLALEIGSGDEILACSEMLARAYQANGHFEESTKLWQKAYALKDSLLGVKNLEIINELQTKYETEKKEQQIALQSVEISGHKVENQRNLAIIVGLVFAVFLLVMVAILSRSRSRKKQALLVQEAETRLKETQIEAAISSQEKERSRFAKDLHDGFGQMISILNLNLKSLEDGGKDKHEVFENSSKVLDEMYQELKGICFNLMPQTLIKHGISAALQEFASRINLTDQILVETDFFGLDKRLTDVQEISLYRISQEWVNNVIKYSDANKVMVQLTKDEKEITLLIEDNGSGFDPELLKQGKGNGWKNMNSRANLINGELELDTNPGIKGNTLIVNAPVTQNAPVSVE
ncbi:MAG: sensor histidine kinase [Marinoscillum sp.]